MTNLRIMDWKPGIPFFTNSLQFPSSFFSSICHLLHVLLIFLILLTLPFLLLPHLSFNPQPQPAELVFSSSSLEIGSAFPLRTQSRHGPTRLTGWASAPSISIPTSACALTITELQFLLSWASFTMRCCKLYMKKVAQMNRVLYKWKQVGHMC